MPLVSAEYDFATSRYGLLSSENSNESIGVLSPDGQVASPLATEVRRIAAGMAPGMLTNRSPEVVVLLHSEGVKAETYDHQLFPIEKVLAATASVFVLWLCLLFVRA